MKQLLFLCIMGAACFTAELHAQNYDDIIDAGVHKYNYMRGIENSLKPGSVSPGSVDSIANLSAETVSILSKALDSETEMHRKVARYFIANAKYTVYFVYGMVGRNKDALPILKEIIPEVDLFTTDYFPLKYLYESKNYSIKYDDYASTRHEFYTGSAEVYYNMGYYTESIELANKSIRNFSGSYYFNFIAYTKILSSKEKLNQYDKEMMEAAVNLIKTFNKLDTSYVTIIRKNKFIADKTAVNMIESILSKNPNFYTGDERLKYTPEIHRASLIKDMFEPRINRPEKGLEFAKIAMQAGYKGWNTDDIKFVLAKSELYKNDETGNLFLKYYFYQVTHDCGDYFEIMRLAELWNNPQIRNEAKNKESDCFEAKRKEEKRKAKLEKRGNHVTAVNIFPLALLPANTYRDFGGNIVHFNKKWGYELAFRKINRNKDYAVDLALRDINTADFKHLWNGYNAGIGIYGVPKGVSFYSRSIYFTGLYAEYSKKDYENIYSAYTETANSSRHNGVFRPLENRFSAMLNMGILTFGKKAPSLHMWMSIGVSYLQWKTRSTILDETDKYKFDDPVLEFRKPSYFVPVMRYGIAIGLHKAKV